MMSSSPYYMEENEGPWTSADVCPSLPSACDLRPLTLQSSQGHLYTRSRSEPLGQGPFRLGSQSVYDPRTAGVLHQSRLEILNKQLQCLYYGQLSFQSSETLWRNYSNLPFHPQNYHHPVRGLARHSLESNHPGGIEYSEFLHNYRQPGVGDPSINCSGDIMALAGGKKLCKLDAICAKLKKISNATASSGNTLTEDDAKLESPGAENHAEVSVNNNVIGKADLNCVDDSREDKDEGLDLTCKVTETGKGVDKAGNHPEDAEAENAGELKSVSQSDDKDEPERCSSAVSEVLQVTPSSSSRRKSRKAATPRNITQVRDLYDNPDEKDELAEYRINNQNTNFPPEEQAADNSYTLPKNGGTIASNVDCHDEDSSSSELNHSGSINNSKDSRRSFHSSGYDSMNGIGTPLDLSMSKDPEDGEAVAEGGMDAQDWTYRDAHIRNGRGPLRSESVNSNSFNDDSIQNYLSTDDEDEDDNFFHPDRNLVIDDGKLTASEANYDKNSREHSKDPGREQAFRLKDYAESTMNELISMYGYSGMGPTGEISKQIPIKNFSAILQQSHSGAIVAPPAQGTSEGAPASAAGGKGHMTKGLFSSLGKAGPSSSAKTTDGSTPSKLQTDRFTTSSSFINAVFRSGTGQSGHSQSGDQTLPGKNLLPNYSKYLKRYNTGSECGAQHCLELGYKEHYHCIDCSFQVFMKKEEMVRHYKWHRKREESLQHGFLRFSPTDNCSKRFGHCPHNSKQTHYHCLQNGCDKVYISTSDVQMHANYHRKDSAIMSEGFQRFRATEDCGTVSCAFFGQRTTHFHCLRTGCKFTFKNKADMEKHKSYHQKDEVLGRDGFKKFMKYEHCMYKTCRYSKVSNHIHCIRPGCDYVLHSTAQLYSHKRKHERRDFENAYKKYRDNHQPPQAIQPSTPNKLLLPRGDYTNLAAQLPLINGNPMIPTLPMLQGIKREREQEQTEPLELKKTKLEPKPQSSSPPSPNLSHSSAGNQFEGLKVGPDGMEVDETSNSSESSFDSSRDDNPVVKQAQDGEEETGLNLSGSLNLSIPQFSPKTEALHAQVPQPIRSQGLVPSGLSALTSLSSVMPGSLSSGQLVTIMNSGAMMTVPSALTGASTALQPPKSIYPERREKDDSWKTYLVRYTANDPCTPRCQYLYKDHYHCKMEGCLVLFKSKDGVREHARFHELQDRITPIAYQGYEAAEECPEKCQYSKKEKHYHCVWTGCTHVVPYVGPTFGRLEHYRIHEYARAAVGKSYNRSGIKGMLNPEENNMRRRGRPPKYPKIELPKIPKVELSDEEIRQSQMLVGEGDVANSSMKVLNGFRVFSPEDPCPDEKCNYYGRLHFHCARPRCFTITDRVDVLNLHAKDFHSFVKILDGFEFFDRNVSCRRLHCQNNQVNRHFHCTRPKCDYSFIRHSTMAQHEKKHLYSESGLTAAGVPPKSDSPVPTPNYRRDLSASIEPMLQSTISPITSASSSSASSAVAASIAAAAAAASSVSSAASALSPIDNIISTAGAFLPVSGMKHLPPTIPLLLSQSVAQLAALSPGAINLSQGTSQAGFQSSVPSSPQISSALIPTMVSSIQALPASVTSSPLITTGCAAMAVSALAPSTTAPMPPNLSAPLTVLLQRGINQIPQPSWNDMKAKMHYALSQNCGRPFCKLKKKDHYHCYDCNQAFSDPARLRSHIGKHGVKLKRENGEKAQRQMQSSVGPSLSPKRKATAEDLRENVGESLDPDEKKCLALAVEEGNASEAEDDKNSSSLNLNPSTFSEMISKAQEQHKLPDGGSNGHSGDSMDDMEGEPGDLKDSSDIEDNSSDALDPKGDQSSRSGRKITKTKHHGFMNSGELNLSKPRRGSSPRNNMVKGPQKGPEGPGGNGSSGSKSRGNFSLPTTRGPRDDSVPDGYSRWRYNEECCYPKCAYRHSVTHFHCRRDDCGYGFSDRSRLVQHTLRHERIDSITGGELQQYRINQDCENADCEFNKKMSHFHCKRCNYCCTDSSKVLTHRKHHAKLDNISNQGFKKIPATEDCGIGVCPYARKQNHFHCLQESCKVAVLGPAQMASHKVKHSLD